MKNLLTLLLIFFSFSIFGIDVIDGKIDLSQENFKKGTFKLNGNWDFSWQTNYADFKHENYVSIPGYWNSKDNGGYPAFGQGSYRVKIRLPKGERKLAIKVNDVHYSYSIWINDSLLHEQGKPSLIEAESIGDWSPLLLPFEIDTNEIELTFVVANYGHRNGGFSSSIYLGRSLETIATREFHFFVDLFIIGGIFILAVFLFGMYLLWSRDNSLVFFLGFALLYALWMSFREEKAFFSVWNNLHWDTTLRIEYGAMFGAIFFFVLFISRIFPEHRIKIIDRILFFVNVISLIIIAVFPTEIFSYLTISNILVIVCITLYFIYVFSKVFKSQESESKYAALSLIILVFVILLEILSFLDIVRINNIILRTISLTFILSIALIFAHRFAGAFNIVVDLKNKAEKQQKDLTTKNNEVYASIKYAKQLQNTILPTRFEIERHFHKSFVLFKPKDIVSGDFYWMEERNGLVYFAAADCTGHGVPGAVVSFVCSSALTKAVIEDKKVTPNEILDRTRDLVIERFSTSESSLNDGMDISLGAYNKETNELFWAGANNPIWIVKKGEETITQIKGNKQPIGNYVSKFAPFTLHKIQINKGDRIYLFSDGFVDQFGGENGKKFKTNQFKTLILSLQNQPISKHKNVILNTFNKWKGNIEQIDDVCIFGIEF